MLLGRTWQNPTLFTLNWCNTKATLCSEQIEKWRILLKHVLSFFPPSLDVLADNGRLTLTGDVINAFSKMMSAHRGEVICSVTTAQVWNGCICKICSYIIFFRYWKQVTSLKQYLLLYISFILSIAVLLI